MDDITWMTIKQNRGTMTSADFMLATVTHENLICKVITGPKQQRINDKQRQPSSKIGLLNKKYFSNMTGIVRD